MLQPAHIQPISFNCEAFIRLQTVQMVFELSNVDRSVWLFDLVMFACIRMPSQSYIGLLFGFTICPERFTVCPERFTILLTLEESVQS